MMQTHTNKHTQTHTAAASRSYLWIAEPEVQTPKVGEKAEASEENPVLESRKRRERGKGQIKKTMNMDENKIKTVSSK